METSTADSSTWEWIPCNYDFKQTTEDGLEIFYSLGPSITLTNPKGNGMEPKVEIKIECEKNFIYNDELGWNWHKSWNIPNFKVRVDIYDPETNEKLAPPKNLNVQVFAVKAMIENLERFHLLDIGIKGENKKPITENEAYFSALKFSSTSYNNDSVKFHLVICVQVEFENDDAPRILNSFISPPVFVDSRKSARDTEKIKAKRVSSLIDPFLPENLDKVFVKRENRRKDCHEEEITNSIEGLINYFTAPNVRHKVKHPLFLTLKFSNCISLYYNTNVLKPDQEDKLVENIQNLLYESQFNSNSQKSAKIEKVPLIMILKNVCPSQNVKSKKIMEHLESIQNSSLRILYDNKIIPSNFKEISDINEIKARYKKVYAYLASSKFKVMTNLAKENRNVKTEEESYEDYEDQDQSDASSMVNKKPAKETPQRVVKIPVAKQTNVANGKIEASPAVAKGGLERPKITKYEDSAPKKVKLEHMEGLKTEDNSEMHKQQAQKMEILKPNSDIGAPEGNKGHGIAAQLELMNKLLMINAMIGMNQPQQQQQQQSPLAMLTQQFQSLGTLLQGQNLPSSIDLGQIGALAQGVLGQNPLNKVLSTNERSSATPTRSMNNNLNSMNSPLHPDSRSADPMMRFNLSSQNDFQRLLMQKMMPQNGGSQSSSNQNPLDFGALAGNLGGSQSFKSAGTQQGSQQSQEMLARNLMKNNLMSLGKLPPGFPDMRLSNSQEMLRNTYQNMSWKADSGSDFSKMNYMGVKEEDEKHN